MHMKFSNKSFIENKIHQMLQPINNQHLLGKLSMKLVVGKIQTSPKLKTNSQSERLDKWNEHFQNILGNTPSISNNGVERIVDATLDIKQGTGGDTLAPFLFVIILDYVLCTSLDELNDMGFTLSVKVE